MKNFKALLVIVAVLATGITNNIVIGGAYTGPGANKMASAQQIITQYVTQYRNPIINPSDYFEISKDFVQGLVNALVPNTFALSDLTIPAIKNQIMTTVWYIPYFANTVTNYAVLQNNQNIYRQRLWQSLDSQITGSIHQISARNIQPTQQRPLPAIPTASPRPLPATPNVSSTQNQQQAQWLDYGIERFNQFVTLTKQIIRVHPEEIYENRYVKRQWLETAWILLTSEGKLDTTNKRNQDVIKGELKPKVIQMVKEVIANDPKTGKLPAIQQDAMGRAAGMEVDQFINNKLGMRARL